MASLTPTSWAYLRRLAHIGAVLWRYYPIRWIGAAIRRLPLIGGRMAPQPAGPERFRAMLEDLGGSFIKLGQVLSLQPDLVPPDYCDELFDLLDRVPPFDYVEVQQTFLDDLGQTPGDLFEEFDPRAFASASIGQVHRARISGREVAVKVQRPTARRDFGGDINLMRFAVSLIERLRLERLYAFRVPINEFIAWTADELDYRTEARYMSEAKRNADDNSLERIPQIFEDLSTSRILTTEYLEATTLLEYVRSLERNDPAVGYRLSQNGFDPDQFADNVITNFLGDVFRHGLFHADLHPANLLILPDNVVGYVDFGITGIISEYGRAHLLQLIQALASQDIDHFFDGVLLISEVTDSSDVGRFRTGLQHLANTWFAIENGVSSLKTSYTVIMLDLLRLSRECNLPPHEEAVRYLRSVITAEGLIGRFAPDYDVSAGLERLSKGHLQRHVIADALSADRLIENWIAASRLLRDGSSRLDSFLERLEKRARPAREATRAKPDEVRETAAATVGLGLIVLTISLLLVLGGDEPSLGLNLFTVEIALLGAGSVQLARSALQWLRASR
jgi:ubiquinone biosynthesis protein